MGDLTLTLSIFALICFIGATNGFLQEKLWGSYSLMHTYQTRTTPNTPTTITPTEPIHPSIADQTVRSWYKPTAVPSGYPHEQTTTTTEPTTSTTILRRYWTPPTHPNRHTNDPRYHAISKPEYKTPRPWITVRPWDTSATPTPPQKSDIPDACNTSYDAIATIRRELFIFKGRYFWRVDENGHKYGYPTLILRFFFGIPKDIDHVDAVYERPDKKIVFFIGKEYYLFDATRLVAGYPKPLTDLGLPSTLEKIDGAMIWGHNGKTYFFSDNFYWRFDEDESRVEREYPRDMVMFAGVGYNIDAVFQWTNGKTYFFKDKGFWEFDDARMKVSSPEPKPSAPVWMHCPKVSDSGEDDDAVRKDEEKDSKNPSEESPSSGCAEVKEIIQTMMEKIDNLTIAIDIQGKKTRDMIEQMVKENSGGKEEIIKIMPEIVEEGAGVMKEIKSEWEEGKGTYSLEEAERRLEDAYAKWKMNEMKGKED